MLQKNIVFECSALQCTVLDKPMNHHQLIGQYRSTFHPPILIWLDKIVYCCSKISAFKACGYNFYSSCYIGDLINGFEENHLKISALKASVSLQYKNGQTAVTLTMLLLVIALAHIIVKVPLCPALHSRGPRQLELTSGVSDQPLNRSIFEQA